MGKKNFTTKDFVISGFIVLWIVVPILIALPKPKHAIPIEGIRASGQIDGYDYVDLGLTVNWATCNFGAVLPSDNGDYYAWGEIETKTEYTKENSITYGKNMGDISGRPQYDVVTANLGGIWRMPTAMEIDELFYKCDWELASLDGRKGYRVTGKNGNSIFLSFAGSHDREKTYFYGDEGWYWSSSPDDDSSNMAYVMSFSKQGSSKVLADRHKGMPIRPVFSKTEIASATMSPTNYTSSNEVSSTIATATGKVNGHDYVDLGLSINWATCNVGADFPSDYGDYFAWGETETKNAYTEETSITYEKGIGDITRVAQYDAANANWGGGWRLPTVREMKELVHECAWEWEIVNGSYGYRVIGANGNSIFLPATGQFEETETYDANEYGYYWSGSDNGTKTGEACMLKFGKHFSNISQNYRRIGQTIRPVISKKEELPSVITGYINGYGYSDLGLSVKWAICNVGASSPSDYGNYYAWGETDTKPKYTKKKCDTYRIKPESIAGNSQYDVARALLGETWRLPTTKEIRELMDECDWEWITQDGHKGYKIIGPNCNSIFLPAAGRCEKTWFKDIMRKGYYWTSSPIYKDKKEAYYLFFVGEDYIFDGWSGCTHGGRYYGYSVRPVSD